ncbi:MAG: Na+/H+ antiporter NhaA [Breznakibacter sp.]
MISFVTLTQGFDRQATSESNHRRILRFFAEHHWAPFTGLGSLGGIGFTLLLLITMLAFQSAELINQDRHLRGVLVVGMARFPC